VDHGLLLLHTDATHGANTIDKVFVSMTNSFTASAIRSVLKTKHLAILVEPMRLMSSSACKSVGKVVKVYDFRQPNIDALRAAIAATDFGAIVSGKFVEQYSTVLEYLWCLIERTIPSRNIKMKPKDPPFYTPFIKML
jgi:hypothetical protein